MGESDRKLRSVEFRRERQKTWRELEGLIERVERGGITSLNQSELTRLPVLYRATVSALSVARAISLDRNLLDYLEGLTARAYFCVYGTKQNFLVALWNFFAVRFPREVRRFRWQLALASCFLLLGAAAGFTLTLADPDCFYSFVGADYAGGRDPAASTEELREVLYSTEEQEGGALTAFSSFLFTHNAQIGILCLALGFAAGLPVFLLLFSNGLLLGAFAALYHSRGLSLDFWGWVLPHGVTELLAVALCGAAGLIQSGSLIFPGRRSRLANLARNGRRAGVILIGCVMMFFAAGLIEGFFRQLVTGVEARYAVILGTGAWWLLYFTRAGREEPR